MIEAEGWEVQVSKPIITIVNLRKKTSRYPYDVHVYRGKSALANPYYLSDVNDYIKRETVCNDYIIWFNKQVNDPDDNPVKAELKRLLEIIKEYGKLNLFCFCYPKRCHAETIKEYLEKQLKE